MDGIRERLAPSPMLARVAARRSLLLGAAVTVAGAAFLRNELGRRIWEAPVYVDEVITGSIAAGPPSHIVEHVMWERGGAPLHYLLAYVALDVEPSIAGIRWPSVFLAVATIAVCYDLGRRLGGEVAGATAAIVAATSSLLTVYASMGRMYALFALTAAVSFDLFVRALDQRTVASACLAAAAAWFLPASHPYGIVIVACEAAIALAVWRGRSVRAALPVAAVALAFAPFVVANLRLVGRFRAGVSGGGETLAGPGEAAELFSSALAGFAGGSGVTYAIFLGLGLAGLIALARSRRAVAALAVLMLAAIPVLLVLTRVDAEEKMLPRHLIFALPVWAAVVGLGVAHGARVLGRIGGVLAVAAVAVLAVVSPPGEVDPRIFTSERGTALAGPARWVEERVGAGDVLYPYSSVFLHALPETRNATFVPANEFTRNALARADLPAPSLFVAVRVRNDQLDPAVLAGRLPSGFRWQSFRYWLVIEAEGPFGDDADVLRAAATAAAAGRAASSTLTPRQERTLRANVQTACKSLRQLGQSCPASVEQHLAKFPRGVS